MLKFILFIIVVLNTSFIDIPTKYWYAYFEVGNDKTLTNVGRVIKAETRKKATYLLDLQIKSCETYYKSKIKPSSIFFFELKKDLIVE